MSEETWKGIIIRSIPPTAKWLPVIPSLYLMNSSDIISTLIAHGLLLAREFHKEATTGALFAKITEGCKNP
jgi:hypothetical protein